MDEKILKSEQYEEMAAAYQCSQIQVLDKVLLENGVSPEKAKEIVESYTLKSGVLLDQYWIDTEEGKFFPTVVFSSKHQDYDPEKFYFNEGSFSFAEYALGNISWYYEENSDNEEPQKMGVVDDNGNPA